MTDTELIASLEKLRNWMTAVATGGPRIESVNREYRETFSFVAEALSKRGIENPLPYNDLWQWYGRWSSGDLPSYQSRRIYISDLIDPLSMNTCLAANTDGIIHNYCCQRHGERK